MSELSEGGAGRELFEGGSGIVRGWVGVVRGWVDTESRLASVCSGSVHTWTGVCHARIHHCVGDVFTAFSA